MKSVVKLALDLSHIKKDPKLKKELCRAKKPVKVAAVIGGTILGAVEVGIKQRQNVSKIPVTIEFDYPAEELPGVEIIIGPNRPEGEFLESQGKRIQISANDFERRVADVTRNRISISEMDLQCLKTWLLVWGR